ncbi:MAG: type I-C CRISPR-associated protein Cas8c/Csd1, partial [Synergistaceae bacterium]|nr:type I-C CRISPR-associated protein Cas8c/Csd1 [Synergistaceae bacterium]
MILQELYDLAIRERLVPDPDFELKPIAWRVYIDRNGHLLNIAGTHYKVPIESKSKTKNKAESKPKFKVLAKQFLVPRDGGRTSGDRAFFFYDKAEYVFGLDVPGEKNPREPERLKLRRSLFYERVRQCAEETGDEAAQKLAAFLKSAAAGGEPIDLASLPEKVAANDLFAFVYQPDIDILMTDREKIRNYWKQSRSREDAAPVSAVRQCLVTGNDCTHIGLFPGLKKVPGGSTSGVGLVSFNAKAFESYGWHSNENAPVCREAAEAVATALNRLIDTSPIDPNDPSRLLPRQNVTLSSDTLTCYWTRGQNEFCDQIFGLLEADPERVGELYRSIWKGEEISDLEDDKFYALTLSGTQGRAILRDWFESTIAKVQKNLSQHFKDLNIKRNNKASEDRPVLRFKFLLEAVADPSQKDRSDTIPGHVASGMLNAAFNGLPYPATVLQRAVARYRCEIGKCSDEKEGWLTRERNDARAALIKAYLSRKKNNGSEDRIRFMEVKEHMDPNNKNSGYLLGRLMAVLEKLQVEALQSEQDEQGETGQEDAAAETGKKRISRTINSTIVDRFFSGASATPKAVFPRLLINSKHHEKKLRDKDPGRMRNYQQYIDEILFHFSVNRYNNQLHKFAEGFPQFLNLDDQGLFIIGYHHMRHWL